MTTIRDFIESIRMSLNEIEQLTDADQEPEISYNEISIESIDAMAHALASRYRRCKRVRQIAMEEVSQ